MRVSLIGVGKELEMEEEVEKIAKVLAENVEIVVLPDKGICFEVAKKYKEKKGKKIIGVVPFDDKDFGIKHLDKYLKSGIFDELINTGDWYKQDMQNILFGDCVLCLGYSLGSIGELSYGYYLYKQIRQKEFDLKKLNKEIRAGENFDLIVYEPFVSGRLPMEIEKNILELGCKIYYVKDWKELEKILSEKS